MQRASKVYLVKNTLMNTTKTRLKKTQYGKVSTIHRTEFTNLLKFLKILRNPMLRCLTMNFLWCLYLKLCSLFSIIDRFSLPTRNQT